MFCPQCGSPVTEDSTFCAHCGHALRNSPNLTPPGPAPAPFRAVIVPPSLHWGIVLLLTFVTGVFFSVWILIQASWVKTIDPASKAIRDFILSSILTFCALPPLTAFAGFSARSGELETWGFGILLLLFFALIALGVFFYVRAVFGMKRSLEHYYNTTEPIHLRLSPWMTFFFSGLYFQYHFSRIAEWKRTGVLPA